MSTFLIAAGALLAATVLLTMRPLVFANGFARPKKTMLAVGAAVPLAAAVLYLGLGNPAALGDHSAAAVAEGNAEVEKMVADFAARMQKNPSDLKGWALLARSYKVMNRPFEAVQAFEKALPFIEKDAQELAHYADALATIANGNLAGKPAEIIRMALKADPNNGMVLWLAGTEALQRKDYDQAIAFWEKVQKQVEPGSDDAREIAGALAQARELAGKPQVAAPAPARAPQAQAVAGASSVSGTVELSDALKAKAQPDDVVMVIARPVGTRMPVAVLRARAAELPLKFTLDDSLAMSPQATISQQRQVEVEARVSKAGQAKAEAGDLLSEVQTVQVGASGLKLRLDRVR